MSRLNLTYEQSLEVRKYIWDFFKEQVDWYEELFCESCKTNKHVEENILDFTKELMFSIEMDSPSHVPEQINCTCDELEIPKCCEKDEK